MNIKKTIRKIKQLDEISQFRLLNAFVFAIGLNMLVPVLIDLKGEYLAAWAISLLLVGEQLIVKTNRWVTEKFSISDIYRSGIITHFFILFSSTLYFWDPFYMIISESIISVIAVAIFGAYSIKLNVHLAQHYPNSVQEFQILRNGTWADGILIGLLLATVITYFLSNGFAVASFLVWNSIYVLWMIKNWNFYKLIENE